MLIYSDLDDLFLELDQAEVLECWFITCHGGIIDYTKHTRIFGPLDMNMVSKYGKYLLKDIMFKAYKVFII